MNRTSCLLIRFLHSPLPPTPIGRRYPELVRWAILWWCQYWLSSVIITRFTCNIELDVKDDATANMMTMILRKWWSIWPMSLICMPSAVLFNWLDAHQSVTVDHCHSVHFLGCLYFPGRQCRTSTRNPFYGPADTHSLCDCGFSAFLAVFSSFVDVLWSSGNWTLPFYWSCGNKMEFITLSLPCSLTSDHQCFFRGQWACPCVQSISQQFTTNLMILSRTTTNGLQFSHLFDMIIKPTSTWSSCRVRLGWLSGRGKLLFCRSLSQPTS